MREEKSFLDRSYIVTMDDGSRWAVPIRTIAINRAKHYSHEYEDDVVRSLEEDTLPMFEHDFYEVHDWASNNMNWSDVEQSAKRVESADSADFHDGWMNGVWEIV